MPVLSALDGPLHNVQHLLRLREQQRLVPLLPPVGQHLRTRHPTPYNSRDPSAAWDPCQQASADAPGSCAPAAFSTHTSAHRESPCRMEAPSTLCEDLFKVLSLPFHQSWVS